MKSKASSRVVRFVVLLLLAVLALGGAALVTADDAGVAGNSAPFAYAVNEEWRTSFGSKSEYRDLAADAQGNLYAVGGGQQGTLLVVKYAPDGTQLWSDSSGLGPAQVVELDSAGNVYAGGAHYGWDEIGLRKYDQAGSILWSLHSEPTIYSELPIGVSDIAVDVEENAYVVGWVPCFIECEALGVAKVSPAGAVAWLRTLSNSGGPSTVDLDLEGNLRVTTNVSSASFGSDIRIAKYTPDGDQLWLSDYRRQACYSPDQMWHSTLDGSGNLYVVGADSATAYPSWDVDAVLLKFDTSGALLWTARSDLTSDEAWRRVALVLDGSIVVTGSTGTSNLGNCSGTATNIETAKYSSAGKLAWLHHVDLDPLLCNPEDPLDIGADVAGSVVVTGYVAHNTHVDGGRYAMDDVFALKYPSDGTPVWTFFDGEHQPNTGYGYNWGWAMLPNKDGGAYVAGVVDGRGALVKLPEPDGDGDGCTNAAESSGNAFLGGQRDSAFYFDFADMPIVTNAPLRDRRVRVGDILAVVQRYFADDDGGTATINRNSDPLSPPPATGYHPAFDRGAQNGPNPWNVALPDGQILVGDILYVVQQYFHDCA